MSEEPTGAAAQTVVVDRVDGDPIRSYSIRIEGGSAHAGRADYLDSAAAERDRIFFHTEVDPEFSGRGLAGQLVRSALEDAITENVMVVPVCPLFAAHLRKHGDAYVADGGHYRAPRPADLALVGRAVHRS